MCADKIVSVKESVCPDKIVKYMKFTRKNAML